jgi:molecular chaperone GrpE
MREETDDHPENTVTNELQKGYLMHDRLIRPSMVVVAMPKNQENDQDNQAKD